LTQRIENQNGNEEEKSLNQQINSQREELNDLNDRFFEM